MKQIQVSKKEEGIKAVKLCQKLLPNAGSSFLYKMMRKKNITLNGKKMSGTETLNSGDVITFFFSEETYKKFQGAATIVEKEQKVQSKVKSSINSSFLIYEDEDIILYNKPAGLLSQKAKPSDESLNDILLAYVNAKSGIDTLQKPSICNRLDRNTSGMVLFGKTYRGIRSLNEMLKDRTCEKYYHCIVKGCVKEPISLKGYLIKDNRTNKVSIQKESKEDSAYIETHLVPIKSNKDMTLLEVHLITGKTHQIRVHLASIGHPILGDLKYGGEAFAKDCFKRYGLKYQLLHAYRMEFPDTEECLDALRNQTFYATKPSKFLEIEKLI